MTELSHKVEPNHDVVFTELENKEAILLHLGTKMYYILNETGLRIWQMLSSGLTLGEIGQKLQDEFDITPEKAKEEVAHFVGKLMEEKLVNLSVT